MIRDTNSKAKFKIIINRSGKYSIRDIKYVKSAPTTPEIFKRPSMNGNKADFGFFLT